MKKQWYTVFAVYDDNEEPYIEYVEAKDKADAKTQALRKAEAPILIAGIAPGKITDAGVDDYDKVVPIRGTQHLIEVTSVTVSPRKFMVPRRCQGCAADLKRAKAMTETFISTHEWLGHLSRDGKTFSHEKDQADARTVRSVFPLARIVCTGCRRALWEGLNVDH